jgi:hypothetical protein
MSTTDRAEALLTALFQRPLPELNALLARDRARARASSRGRTSDADLLALIARHRRRDHPGEVLARRDLSLALGRLGQLPLTEVRAACLQRSGGQALAAAVDVVLALHACRGVSRAQGVPAQLLAGGVWFGLCGMPLPTPAQAEALLPLRGHLRAGFLHTFALLRSLSRQAA